MGFKLPEGMDFRSLLVAGVTASLGLTVALFVAGVAFTEPVLQGSAKMGALFSAFAAPFAILLGRILGVRGAKKDVALEEKAVMQGKRGRSADKWVDEAIQSVLP